MALLTVNMMSQALMRTVTFNVFLPVDQINFTGSKLNKPPYKTLYLLHGIFGDQNDWMINTRVVEFAKKYDLALVMPAGENRFYLDNPVAGTNFGEFVGQELLQMTREILPLSHRKEDTFIAGLSMGGYGSLRNGLKYAAQFGAVGSFSGAMLVDQMINATDDDPLFFRRRSYYESIFGNLKNLKKSDKNPEYLLGQVGKEEIPRLFVSCGTEDPLLEANQKFHKELQSARVEHTYLEWPGGHDWTFWDQSIEKFINWLDLPVHEQGVSSGNVVGKQKDL